MELAEVAPKLALAAAVDDDDDESPSSHSQLCTTSCALPSELADGATSLGTADVLVNNEAPLSHSQPCTAACALVVLAGLLLRGGCSRAHTSASPRCSRS